ncbi:hypothetical protein AV944_09845 [Sphingomonas sp. LK11]|nr:hypothetical protein AV944_09845 [Sphingomonas sp. LK11]
MAGDLLLVGTALSMATKIERQADTAQARQFLGMSKVLFLIASPTVDEQKTRYRNFRSRVRTHWS